MRDRPTSEERQSPKAPGTQSSMDSLVEEIQEMIELSRPSSSMSMAQSPLVSGLASGPSLPQGAWPLPHAASVGSLCGTRRRPLPAAPMHSDQLRRTSVASTCVSQGEGGGARRASESILSSRSTGASAARVMSPPQPLPPLPLKPTSASKAATPMARTTSLSSVTAGDEKDAALPQYSASSQSVYATTPIHSLLGTHVDLSRLSHMAQLLSRVLERQPLIKGSVKYPMSFTGRTLVHTIAAMLVQFITISPIMDDDASILPVHAHQMALSIARSLKTQLFVHEVDWEEHVLTDDVDGVFMLFSDHSISDKHGSGLDSAPGLPVDQLFLRDATSSVALSATGAAACASAQWDELPTGLMTPLTACYSPTCALSHTSSCYVPSCPRFRRGFVCGKEESTPASTTAPMPLAWVETVPAEIVASLPKDEVKRQNAIHEFIQKEESFLSDLALMKTYAQRLQSLAQTSHSTTLRVDAPLRGDTLTSFVADVFGLVDPLYQHIAVFVDRLHERQREQGIVVQTLGDIVVQSALEWADAYTSYVAHYPYAQARVKVEAASNARMQQFIDDCRRDPAAQRHALEHFLFRPPARLQRYHLHLESIWKRTAEANDDREALTLAMHIIDEQCRIAQDGVTAAEQHLEVRAVSTRLHSKRPESFVDMDLRHPDRQLRHRATVYRRPDNFEFEWTALEAILFDNYFVLAKPKKEEEEAEETESMLREPSHTTPLFVSKRPIPVSCLEAGGFLDPPLVRTTGSRRVWPTPAGEMYAFSVWHRFRPSAPMTLYVTSKEEREAWRTVLLQSAQAYCHTTPSFHRVDVSGDAFAPGPHEPLLSSATTPRDATWTPTQVTCVTTWSHRASDTVLVAIGTNEGVWFGRRGQPASLRKVLYTKHVTQVAVLARHRRFLVLADRTLVAYDLEALVPSGGRASPSVAPIRLGGTRDVQFFALGETWQGPMLVYAKRKATESSIRLLTPITIRVPGTDEDVLTGFHMQQKFYVYPEATGIQCTPHALVVCTPRQFYLYHIAKAELVPYPAPRQHDEAAQVLLRGWDGARPLGAFSVPSVGWLLCFDRGAYFVDDDGQLVHAERRMVWEVPVQYVAYSDGVVIACGESLLELHDAQTGHLIQVLPGRDLRLVSRIDAAAEPALLQAPIPMVVETRTSTHHTEPVPVSTHIQRVSALVRTHTHAPVSHSMTIT